MFLLPYAVSLFERSFFYHSIFCLFNKKKSFLFFRKNYRFYFGNVYQTCRTKREPIFERGINHFFGENKRNNNNNSNNNNNKKEQQTIPGLIEKFRSIKRTITSKNNSRKSNTKKNLIDKFTIVCGKYNKRNNNNNNKNNNKKEQQKILVVD